MVQLNVVCLCSVHCFILPPKCDVLTEMLLLFFGGGVQKQDGMTLLCSIVILKTQPHEIFK